jgi:acyl-CoA thioesterase-1
VTFRFFILTTLAASAVLLSLPQSTDGARRDASAMKTVLVLGDSLSAGFRLRRAEAYPALVAENIRAAGLNYEVINAGVSGDTTAGGLRRLPNYLRRRIDVLILELGINDAFRGVPVDQIRANLQAIIDAAKTKNPGIAIVVAGMQIPQFATDSYVRAFGEMFSELAEKNNAALVPYLLAGVASDPSLNLPDRIHPNAGGHRILAANVWRVLEPLLQKASTAAASR